MNIHECRFPYLVTRPVPILSDPYEFSDKASSIGVLNKGRVIFLPERFDTSEQCVGYVIGTGMVYFQKHDGEAMVPFSESGVPELIGDF